jgi:hypothetical protein
MILGFKHLLKHNMVKTQASPPQGARKQTGIATTEIPSYGIYYNPILKFCFAKMEKTDVSI